MNWDSILSLAGMDYFGGGSAYGPSEGTSHILPVGGSGGSLPPTTGGYHSLPVGGSGGSLPPTTGGFHSMPVGPAIPFSPYGNYAD